MYFILFNFIGASFFGLKYHYFGNVFFKALNDPTRREILDLLNKKDMTSGEIADQFDMTKPSISHHLDLLKQAGYM